MIRKFFLCCVILTAICSVVAFGAGKTTYYIPDCDVSIDIPDDYYVVYKDMDDNNPALDYLNLSKEEALSELDSLGVYLDAFDLSGSFDLCVSLTDTGEYEYDFNTISDSYLLETYNIDNLNNSSDGIVFTNVKIYKPGDIKFVKAEATQSYNGSEGGFIEYMTSNSHYLIVVSMRTYNGHPSSAQESILQNAVDSIYFGSRPSDESFIENQGEIHYTDSETGVTFTVPEYWTEDTMNVSTDLVCKFQSSKNQDSLIMYGRYLLDDPSTDTSEYTVEMIAEDLGISSDQVLILEYGGKEYRGGPCSQTIDIDGETFTSETLYLVHVENGWMYYFHFVGDETSEQFTDFESVLNSVKYPSDVEASQSANSVAVNDSNQTTDGNAKISRSTGIIVVVCIALIALVGVLAFVVTHNKKTKKEALNNDSTASVPPNRSEECENIDGEESEQQRIFCYNCGAPLRSDSKFCEHCGTQIVINHNRKRQL